MNSNDRRVKGIFFGKNFGQTAAFDAGFRAATGDLVVTIDADLQNDPHDIPDMIRKLQTGYDVVTGVRVKRKDGFVLRKIPSKIANYFIRGVTRTKIHDLGCSLRVYKATFTRQLLLYGEMHRFIGPMLEDMGAKIAEVPVNHRPRGGGTSKYGLMRTVKVLLDLTTFLFMQQFKTKPMYFFGSIGLAVMILGIACFSVVAYEKWIMDVWVHRNPLFLIGSILEIMGVHFLSLGIIAEVLMRTYYESQSKPSYFISEKIGF